MVQSHFQWREQRPRRLIWHEESFDKLSLDDVTLHDFLDVRLGGHSVPDAFRIDDDAGSLSAIVQAPRFIRADDSFQVQPLGLLLETSMQGFRTEFGATAARVVGLPFIRTDENVSLIACHACCSAKIVWEESSPRMKTLDQLFHVRDVEERRTDSLCSGDSGNFLKSQLSALFRFRLR